MRHQHAAFHQSIIAKLDALRAAANDQFDLDRDTLHYGDLADAARIDRVLDQALQMVVPTDNGMKGPATSPSSTIRRRDVALKLAVDRALRPRAAA